MLETIPEGPRKSSCAYKQLQKSWRSHKRTWIPGDRRRPQRVGKSTCSVPRGPRKISKGRHVHLFSSKGTQKDLKDSTFSFVQFQGDPEDLKDSTLPLVQFQGDPERRQRTHTQSTRPLVEFVLSHDKVALLTHAA